jgi:hypothetical protein
MAALGVATVTGGSSALVSRRRRRADDFADLDETRDDLDADGRLDLYLTQGGPPDAPSPNLREPDRFFRQLSVTEFIDIAGRAGIDEECGQLAVFLASPMSSYITGATIPIDGGTWASSGWIRDSKDQWILPPEA